MGSLFLLAQNNPDDAAATAFGVVGLACVAIFGLLFYFLPTFIAGMRGHHNTLAIVILNVLAGWTFFGWVAALVWACTAVERKVGSISTAPAADMPQPSSTSQVAPKAEASNKTLWIILAVVGGAVLVGCCTIPVLTGLLVPAVQRVREAAERTKRMNELSEIGKAIHKYHDANKRMPTKLDDIKPYLPDIQAQQRILNGEIDVIWNAQIFGEEDRGLGNVIMAWETKPAANGQRRVLFMDASVGAVSEDQFRNMPKVRTVDKKDEPKK